MKTNSALNTITLGFDNKVWWTMLCFVVMSLSLMAYRKSTSKNCVDYVITVKNMSGITGGDFTTGDKIRFSASVTSGNIVWNFGDNSENLQSNFVAFHSFTNEGRYTVTAMVNGICKSARSVYIHKQNSNATNNHPVQVRISGKDTPAVNSESVYFTDEKASNYEWTILNRNEYAPQPGRIANFHFKTTGNFTIQLKLDNDLQKVYRKDIVVIEGRRLDKSSHSQHLPVTPFNFALAAKKKQENVLDDTSSHLPNERASVSTPITPPNTTSTENIRIQVTDKQLRKAFEQVIKGSMKISDFDSYLCAGSATKILINNKNHKTLEEFFKDIYGNDKRRIDHLEAVRENDCIISVNITGKKKNILGIWVDL